MLHLKYRLFWVELILVDKVGGNINFVTNIKISVLYNKIFIFTMSGLNEKKCKNKTPKTFSYTFALLNRRLYNPEIAFGDF
jgi:hypothetical protein